MKFRKLNRGALVLLAAVLVMVLCIVLEAGSVKRNREDIESLAAEYLQQSMEFYVLPEEERDSKEYAETQANAYMEQVGDYFYSENDGLYQEHAQRQMQNLLNTQVEMGTFLDSLSGEIIQFTDYTKIGDEASIYAEIDLDFTSTGGDFRGVFYTTSDALFSENCILRLNFIQTQEGWKIVKTNLLFTSIYGNSDIMMYMDE